MLLAAGSTLTPLSAASLQVGDPAPPLRVGKWVQGAPVTQFEPGKVYLVEFWATWCGACRSSIPRLNEIHNLYQQKGVVVVGQNCWQKDDGAVEPFVKKMGSKMSYRIALDDKQSSSRGAMTETWMDAADRHGIPTVFIVDKLGRIAWINYPWELSDEVIQTVLARKQPTPAMNARTRNRQWRVASTLNIQIRKAIQAKDWATVSAGLDKAESKLDGPPLHFVRLPAFLARREYAAAVDAASKLFESLAPTAANAEWKAKGCNFIAWAIATDDLATSADLGLAEELARAADAACQHRNPAVIDTLARVLFRQQKVSQALALQEQAVNLSGRGAQSDFAKTLASYRRGELPKAAPVTLAPAGPSWGIWALLCGLIALLVYRLKKTSKVPPPLPRRQRVAQFTYKTQPFTS